MSKDKKSEALEADTSAEATQQQEPQQQEPQQQISDTPKAAKPTILELIKNTKADLRELTKDVHAHARRLEQLETITDKTALGVEKLAGVVSAASQKAEAVADRIVQVESLLNRLNNLVSELSRPAGTYSPGVVGAVIAKTGGHQMFMFASRLTYAEAEEAIRKELKEKPDWQFAFIPLVNLDK